MSYNKIAEWLNRKGYLSVRGKVLKGLKDKKLERKYPHVCSDFYLDIYDKSLIRLK
jgi:hypothetical protein